MSILDRTKSLDGYTVATWFGIAILVGLLGVHVLARYGLLPEFWK